MSFVKTTRGYVARHLKAIRGYLVLWLLVGPGTLSGFGSDGGPLLLIPGQSTPGNDEAKSQPADEAFIVTDVQPRVGQGSLESQLGPGWDGWTKKGQSPARNAPQSTGGSQASSGIVSRGLAGSPPPASLTVVPSATPLTGAPPASAPSVGPGPASGLSANLPYPYGTPAPPPPLEPPRRSFLGLPLPRLFTTDSPSKRPSPLAEWWNSLWGKAPPQSTAVNGTPGLVNGAAVPMTAGSGPVWNPVTGISPPGNMVTTARPETWNGQPRPQVSAYVTPYALPPQQNGSGALTTPPLTPGPQSGDGAGAGGSWSGPASAFSPQSPSGTPGSPRTVGDGRFDQGWTVATEVPPPGSATPPASMSGPISGPSAVSPGSPSASVPGSSGVYMVTPGASVTPGTGWSSPGTVPAPTPKPSLLDRIRVWWADVTAPKGAQGRQMLLPPGRQPQGGIFRQLQPAPQTDPFTVRTGPVYALPSASSPGLFPGSSPAVLPPPSPQLPLRQAW